MINKSGKENAFLTLLGLSQYEQERFEPRSEPWCLEPELACPIPRCVVPRWGVLVEGLVLSVVALGLSGLLFSGGRTPSNVFPQPDFGFWVATVFTGFCFLVGAAELFNFKWHYRLVIRGTATRGIVAEARRYGTSSPRGAPATFYDYVIAYDAPTRFYLKLGHQTFERSVGDALTLLYLPESPQEAMVYEVCAWKAVASPPEDASAPEASYDPQGQE
jgi:hypothetical protein